MDYWLIFSLEATRNSRFFAAGLLLDQNQGMMLSHSICRTLHFTLCQSRNLMMFNNNQVYWGLWTEALSCQPLRLMLPSANVLRVCSVSSSRSLDRRYRRIRASVLICRVLCLLSARCQAIDHGPLSLVIQPIFSLPSSLSFQHISAQLPNENAAEDGVKSFTEVKMYLYIHKHIHGVFIY